MSFLQKIFGNRNTETPQRSIALLQDDIVRSLAGDLTDLHDGEWDDREWVQLAVNHELLIAEGARSSSQAIVLARHPGKPLESLSFRLSAATKTKLVELQKTMDGAGRGVWTVADIVIDRDGAYEFNFGYDAPRRIGGDLLHAPLNGYLERYLAQKPQ